MKRTEFSIEKTEYEVQECDFCSREERPKDLVEVKINPRVNLAVDYSETMREVIKKKDNEGWVFEERRPTWDEGHSTWDRSDYPRPVTHSYNPGMVKLSVDEMMKIFDEALQVHDDGSIEVCEYCADKFK